MAGGMKMDGFPLEDQLAHLEAVASYDMVSNEDAPSDLVNMLEQLVHHLEHGKEIADVIRVANGRKKALIAQCKRVIEILTPSENEAGIDEA